MDLQLWSRFWNQSQKADPYGSASFYIKYKYPIILRLCSRSLLRFRPQ
jgi:hypothetical protein